MLTRSRRFRQTPAATLRAFTGLLTRLRRCSLQSGGVPSGADCRVLCIAENGLPDPLEFRTFRSHTNCPRIGRLHKAARHSDAVVAFARMALRLDGRIAEAEINPLFVLPAGPSWRAVVSS